MHGLGPYIVANFVAHSHTPHDRCVRFVPAVTDDHATLATRRPATALPGPDFHRLDRTSFAWRTHIRLGAAAELDFANILKWTTENFGARQSRVYRNTIVRPIGELADGLDVAGSKARDEIIPSLRTLHVARQGRGGSHFLMYRIASNSTIEIVRILHNRMDDLQRHVPLARREETE